MSKKNSRRRTRNVLLIVSMMLVVAMASVGGTLAWLTAESSAVTNTFTAGDINITLQEHDYEPNTNMLNTTAATVTSNSDYKVVPGVAMPKDPYVTVKANSEACWLFVKVDKTNWNNDLTYSLDDGTTTTTNTNNATSANWQQLTGVENVDNVYYITVDATTEDVNYNILKACKVEASSSLTKATLEGFNTSAPKLVFTAYACQKAEVNTAAEAWAKLNPADT